MAQTSSTDTLKGIVRESFLLLLGACVCYLGLNIAISGDPWADIMYTSPGFWIFILSPYLGLQLVRSIRWAGKNLKNPGE